MKLTFSKFSRGGGGGGKISRPPRGRTLLLPTTQAILPTTQKHFDWAEITQVGQNKSYKQKSVVCYCTICCESAVASTNVVFIIHPAVMIAGATAEVMRDPDMTVVGETMVGGIVTMETDMEMTDIDIEMTGMNQSCLFPGT